MSAPAEAVALRLHTPAAWLDLDLDPATRSASIDRLLVERAATPTDALRASLEAAAEEAARQGAAFASLFSDTLDGKALSASLIVSVVDAEFDGEPEADPSSSAAARAAIAQGLVAEFLGDGSAASVRTLAAGPAARVRRRLSVEAAPRRSDRPGEVDTLQYFVPSPGADRLAVLTFSTPNLGLADAFAEVFDAIASTVQWPS